MAPFSDFGVYADHLSGHVDEQERLIDRKEKEIDELAFRDADSVFVKSVLEAVTLMKWSENQIAILKKEQQFIYESIIKGQSE